MRKKNKKVSPPQKPFLALSRKAVAGWLVAVFFVCAWMFAIGVLVGRGTSPLRFDIDQLQKKLQIATQQLKKKELGQALKKPDGGQDKPELEFYEELKKNRDDTEISSMPSHPPVVKKADPPAQKPSYQKKFSMKRKTKIKKQTTVQLKSPQKQPTTKSGPQSLTSSQKSDSAGKAYTIQVAAFKTAAEADKLVAKLKQKGFTAFRKLDKVQDKGIWYRVRVGEYKNRTEAGSTMTKLKKAGQKPILVKK